MQNKLHNYPLKKGAKMNLLQRGILSVSKLFSFPHLGERLCVNNGHFSLLGHVFYFFSHKKENFCKNIVRI